ncbi:hypothetical protein [Nocardioides sp. CFH 31398]|uniref:hypothetical protein n=1 Tax=Nocardioides sp. CFH 31398 TaxID=2919579 RepID=UPI001F05F62D|nr:hypothetical protein [Nocardioides sp. CFH 31398]MCH1866812.1 hypothetical protein [Nocardioides sp. CFH 31398]
MRRVPEPLWWAVLPVLAGFFVAWPDLVDGRPADLLGCPLLDWADLVSGSLAVLLVLAGVVVQWRRPAERRCQPQLLMGLVVFLGGLGVYHLLTGVGRLGGVCS